MGGVIRRGHVNSNPQPDGGDIPAAATFDTGEGLELPLVSTAIAVGGVRLLGAHFINTNADERIVTLTNTAGALVSQLRIPAGAEAPYPGNTDRPVDGLKWDATGAGVKGHVWGYLS